MTHVMSCGFTVISELACGVQKALHDSQGACRHSPTLPSLQEIGQPEVHSGQKAK